MRKPSNKQINSILKGLRLIAMESNGPDDAGNPKMGIDARVSVMHFLARMGNADHLIRERPHNWLVMVVVVIRDWRGDYDTQHHFFTGKGCRINDLAEYVQPALDKVCDSVNQKFIIDWGWIAEILPTSKQDRKQDLETYYDRAEKYLEKWIINRHIENEGDQIV